jgi:DNA-binding GntR family transcriptional regulator
MPRRARTDSSHYRKLDRQSSTPLYHQLADALNDAIDASSLPPGSRFLTEREISERYEVSRPVIRSALDLLVGEGSIVRVRGSGSFIAPPKREVSVRGLASSLLASDSDGLDLHILTARQESPDSTLAETLDIRHQHDPVAHITAVMHRDNRPVYLIDSYVAATRLPWLPAAAQALQAGAKMPDSSSRPELTRTEVSLKGGFFGHWGASQLGLSAGDPALIASFVQLGKTRRNGRERPLEFARIFYRTDNTELSI